MNTKLPCLVLAALVLIAFNANADDFAWGSTTANSVVLIDATTGLLQSLPYKGVLYTNFPVVNSANNNGLSNPVLAQNNNGTLYVLDGNGALYTINTTLVPDQNNNPCFKATIVKNSLAVNNVQGAVFINTNLLDISSGQSLYQYNLTTQVTTTIGSFSNANISGLAYNVSLYGVQYSPSPGSIDSISVINLSALKNSSFQGANGQSCMFAGLSLLYLFDGNQAFYSYSTVTNTLTSISNNFKAQGNVRSLTPTSSTGGSAPTPTPAPTATPTPAPTATPTPTPTATPNADIPTGTLTATAPETTPQGLLQCAPGYQYSATETASFVKGGKFDSQGNLGVYRYCETRSSGGTFATPVALTSVAVNDKFWPANSGFANTRSFGPYTAAKDCNGLALGDSYGRETLKLVYTLDDGTQYVLDTKVIYLYPWTTGQSLAPSASIVNAITNATVQGNPSPYAAPSPSPYLQGDPPRVTVQMNNLYPSGTSAVIIYTGTPVSNPTATGFQTIQTAVSPSGGLWTNLSTPPPQAVTFELARYISTSATTPQTYTIAAVQQLPSAYAISGTPPLNPAILNTVTFTIAPGSPIIVNGTVGTVK